MSLLVDIQAAVVAQIEAQPFFAGGGDDGAPVPVLAQDKGDIVNAIETAIAQIGACVVVAIGDAPVQYPDIPGARKEGMSIVVMAFEVPAINRAGGSTKTALEIAEAAEAALHLVTLPVDGVSVLRSKGIFANADAPDSGISYSVQIELDAGGGEPEGRVIPQVTWPDDPPPGDEPGYEYGRLANGRIEVRSLTTGLWHPLYVTGPAGSERIAIGQGVAE